MNKRILLFLVLIKVFSQTAKAQWDSIAYVFNDEIVMTSDSIGYATSGGYSCIGNLFYHFFERTTDDWQSREYLRNTSSSMNQVVSLSFLNDSVGMYVGGAIVNITKDSGNTWIPFGRDTSNSNPWKTNINQGYIVGAQLINDSLGFICLNGFTKYGKPHDSLDILYKVTKDTVLPIFMSDTLEFALGLSPWREYSQTALDNIDFITDSIGYILMQDTGNTTSYAYKTDDQGATWSLVLSDSVNRFYTLSFVDTLVGYIASRNNQVFSTKDGGKTWKQLNGPSTNHINEIDFYTKDIGYISDSLSIYRTDNAGLTWAKEYTYNANSTYNGEIYLDVIIDSNIVYARVSWNDIIIKRKGPVVVSSKKRYYKQLKSTIYPNPVSNILRVRLNNQDKKPLLEIYDLKGRLIIEERDIQLDVSDLSPGVYLLKIESEGEVLQEKIIKSD